jgi:hypothetical protein
MRVTKPGVTNGGSTGSMRAEGGAYAAYSQPQQGEEGADEGRHRHALGWGGQLMRVAIGMLSKPRRGGGRSRWTGGEMHVARPMCMRMSVRLRGYVSTSSHPAFMHEHVGTAAAGGGRVVFNCKSGAPPRCRLACALHMSAWSGRALSSRYVLCACGRGAGARGQGGERARTTGLGVI